MALFVEDREKERSITVAKKVMVPDLELIRDVSLVICREFVTYAKQYYDEHKDNELLQNISKSVGMYEDLFRETIYTLLCLKRRTTFYEKEFLKPFVSHLEDYLTKEGVYRECVRYRVYYVTMLDKMIDKAVFRMLKCEPQAKDKIDTRVSELVNELKVEEVVQDGSSEN